MAARFAGESHRSTRYERMGSYLAEGHAVAFVGSPHVVGISRMLKEDRYAVEQCDTLGTKRPH